MNLKKDFNDWQMGAVEGDWVKTVKGLRSTDLKLQNSHKNIKHSIGNPS